MRGRRACRRFRAHRPCRSARTQHLPLVKALREPFLRAGPCPLRGRRACCSHRPSRPRHSARIQPLPLVKALREPLLRACCSHRPSRPRRSARIQPLPLVKALRVTFLRAGPCPLRGRRARRRFRARRPCRPRHSARIPPLPRVRAFRVTFLRTGPCPLRGRRARRRFRARRPNRSRHSCRYAQISCRAQPANSVRFSSAQPTLRTRKTSCRTRLRPSLQAPRPQRLRRDPPRAAQPQACRQHSAKPCREAAPLPPNAPQP